MTLHRNPLEMFSYVRAAKAAPFLHGGVGLLTRQVTASPLPRPAAREVFCCGRAGPVI